MAWHAHIAHFSNAISKDFEKKIYYVKIFELLMMITLFFSLVDRPHEDYHRSIIIKRQIVNLARRKLFRSDVAFINEMAAYAHIVPCLRKFIGPHGHLPLPECLRVGTDAVGDIIALEDLKPSGHRMANRLKGLDYSHCRIVMQVNIEITFKLSLTMCFSLVIAGIGRAARYGACDKTIGR